MTEPIETTPFETKFLESLDAAQNFQITNLIELEEFREKFLGVKGVLKELFNELIQSEASDRKLYGDFIRKFKDVSESKYLLSRELLLP